MQKYNVLGRQSQNFLVIARGDPLVETVSKLLKKPGADWVLVEWEEAGSKHYSIFKFRFFVQRFVTPNLASSDNPGLDKEEGERRYQHLLARTLAKSATTPPMSGKIPFMRMTEQEIHTAIELAASQHVITQGVQEGKMEWNAEEIGTALQATLAKVVVRKNSASPAAVWQPVKPSFPLKIGSSTKFKIVIPNEQEIVAHISGSDAKAKIQKADLFSGGAQAASGTQTLATFSHRGNRRSSRLIFDEKAAEFLAQRNLKINPGLVKTSVSSAGEITLLMPIDSVGLTPAPGTGRRKFVGEWKIQVKDGGLPGTVVGAPHSEPLSEMPTSPSQAPQSAGPDPESPAGAPQGLGQKDKQNYQPHQLFPEISCKPSHVVQKNKFTVIVRVLRVKPPTKQTKGDFWLPPGPADQVHTVDVHLLMRGESKQGEMKCSAAAGTVKDAVFELKAPEMETDKHGNWKASMFEQIRVNFYLKGRWCGEAQTNIEILRDKKVKHCDRFPDAKEPVWRQHLHIEPGAEPPDLLVRIQRGKDDSFRWTLMSPHLNFKAIDQDCVHTLAKPEQYVQDNFEWLAGNGPAATNRDNVEGSCEILYRATPQAFKDAYWQLFRAAKAQSGGTAEGAGNPIKFKTIQFVSDEPCVPWEIMRVVDRDVEPDVAPVILSEKYQVGRWLAKSSCILRSQINVREFRVSTSTYSGMKDVSELKWTKDERDYLSAEPWKAEPLNLLLEDVRKFLAEGTAEAIHFACHGVMDQAHPQRSRILLEDDSENFRTTAVDKDSSRMGIGKHHLLVFLNACQLGAGGMVLSLGSGWPQAFLDVGASAFIGPLWSIQDESARDAAIHFYKELSAGKSLGEALQTMRRKWVDGGSVTFLAYTLYGDPTAKVVRLQATSEA